MERSSLSSGKKAMKMWDMTSFCVKKKIHKIRSITSRKDNHESYHRNTGYFHEDLHAGPCEYTKF